MEDPILEIEGVEYKIQPEVFELTHMISLERDTYMDYISGEITKKELLNFYPDTKIKSDE